MKHRGSGGGGGGCIWRARSVVALFAGLIGWLAVVKDIGPGLELELR